MRVFEVTTEHCISGGNEITTTRSYVTAEDNTLLSVVKHFTKHCFEYEKELIGVKEVLTIVEHIPLPREEKGNV